MWWRLRGTEEEEHQDTRRQATAEEVVSREATGQGGHPWTTVLRMVGQTEPRRGSRNNDNFRTDLPPGRRGMLQTDDPTQDLKARPLWHTARHPRQQAARLAAGYPARQEAARRAARSGTDGEAKAPRMNSHRAERLMVALSPFITLFPFSMRLFGTVMAY